MNHVRPNARREKVAEERIARVRKETDLAALVSGANVRLRRDGGDLRGLCPFHDDHSPSLVVFTGGDGEQRFRCYGCEAKGDAIEWVRRLEGLDFVAAVERLEGVLGTTPVATARARAAHALHDTAPSCADAIRARLRRMGGKQVGRWQYLDAEGALVGGCLRFDPPEGRKRKEIRYFWRHGAKWSEQVRRDAPLYGLPEILAADPATPILVVEGEKTADAARRCGFIATTSPYGAGKGDHADWSPLRDRVVLLSPDNDDAGERHVADVSERCRAAGARDVRVVRLADSWPEMPPKGDLADLLDHRGDPDAVRAEVLDLASRAPSTPEPPDRGGRIASSAGDGEPSATTDGGSEPKVERDAAGAAPDQDAPDAAGEQRPGTDEETDLAALPIRFLAYPVHALPEPLRSFAEAGSRQFGVDASFLAMPLLAGAAAAIGSTRILRATDGGAPREYPAILWTAIVAPQGSGKTPTMRAALRPLDERDRELRRSHELALRNHEEQKREADSKVEEWRSKGRKGERPRDPGPPPPPARIVVGDSTIEALAPLLRANPRGLLLKRDELKAWLASFDRYSQRGGGDGAQWCQLWNGDPVSVDRKTSGSVYVPRPCLSIAGGIQPSIFLRSTDGDHRDSGLVSRFLLARPPRGDLRWRDETIPPEIAERVAGVFDRLLALEPAAGAEDGPTPVVVRLDPAGLESLVAHHDAIEHERSLRDEERSGMWSKLLDYLGRISLVVHEVRIAAGDLRVVPGLVDAESVHAAATIVRWHGRELDRIEDAREQATSPDRDRELAELVELIRAAGGSITPGDLRRRSSRHRPPGLAVAALDRLAKDGVAEWRSVPSGPKGGAPSRRLHLLDADDADGVPTRVEL